MRELETLVEFYREVMAYTVEREDEGAVEPEAVWKATEKVQLSIHDHEREAGELFATRQTVARQYGGERWQELFVLFAW